MKQQAEKQALIAPVNFELQLGGGQEGSLGQLEKIDDEAHQSLLLLSQVLQLKKIRQQPAIQKYLANRNLSRLKQSASLENLPPFRVPSFPRNKFLLQSSNAAIKGYPQKGNAQSVPKSLKNNDSKVTSPIATIDGSEQCLNITLSRQSPSLEDLPSLNTLDQQQQH